MRHAELLAPGLYHREAGSEPDRLLGQAVEEVEGILDTRDGGAEPGVAGRERVKLRVAPAALHVADAGAIVAARGRRTAFLI